jgi:hypothetical protein
MKRPVLGTISILLLLAVGLYLGLYQFRDRVPGGTAGTDGNRSYSGAAARSAIQANLDLIVPATAGTVYCQDEDLERTKLVFARFDVPTIDLPSLLDQRPIFPAYADLKPDPVITRAMAAQADATQRPWWDLKPEAKETLAGHKSGKRNAAPAVLKWRIQVAAIPLPGGASRVYIAFSEEPAADTEK